MASKVALIQTQEAELIKGNCTNFSLSKRAEHMRQIDPSMPSKMFVKLAEDLPRRHVSMLIQLHTGHIMLNKHLHCIGRKNSLWCTTCRSNKTVIHYLMECKRYDKQRKTLESNLKREARSIHSLLSNPLAIPALFQFISETKRFKNTNRDFQFTEHKMEKWDKARKEKECKAGQDKERDS